MSFAEQFCAFWRWCLEFVPLYKWTGFKKNDFSLNTNRVFPTKYFAQFVYGFVKGAFILIFVA